MDQTAPALQHEHDSGELVFDDQQNAYRGAQALLTPAAQAFAEHWANNRNQIKAYIHAYPHASVNHARRDASRLFADSRVQAEIRRVIERWTDHSVIKLVELEHELSRLGRSDVRLLFDERGNVRPPHEWDADTAAAVSSYQEEERWEGRGEDRVKVTTRKVRLAEKHGPLRTLAEMKGAFDRNKAPPGIQASFTINLGAGPQALGGQGQSFTVDVGGSSAAPKPKKTPKHKALTAPDIDAAPKTAPAGVFQPVKRKKPKKPGKQALRARRRALQAGLAGVGRVSPRSKGATQPHDGGKMATGGVFQPVEAVGHIYNGAIEQATTASPLKPASAPDPSPVPTSAEAAASTAARRQLFGDKA